MESDCVRVAGGRLCCYHVAGGWGATIGGIAWRRAVERQGQTTDPLLLLNNPDADSKPNHAKEHKHQ